MQHIGFVGLGVMGLPMARNLSKAGYSLTVFDIDAKRVATLKAQCPTVAAATSAAVVAAASEIVVTMLPSGKQVHDSVFGPEGLAAGFRAGSLLLDTSSSEPWFTQDISERLAKQQVSMVDAPVSGAEAGALAAELVFMVGGDKESVRRISTLLGALGRTMFHLGPIGAGHAMKSINNLVTAITFMATAEGLIIGKRYGLDPAVMNEVLNVSTGMSWISQNHIAQRILSRRFDDPFKLDLMVKDIAIALEVAGNMDLDVPLSTATQALWLDAQSTLSQGSSVSELVRAMEVKAGTALIA